MSYGIVSTTIYNFLYRVLPSFSSTTTHLYVVILFSRVVGYLVTFFYLLEVLGDPVLSSILIPCLPLQVVDHLPCQSDVGHGVEYHGVGDVVTYPDDLAVEAGLDSVDVLPFHSPTATIGVPMYISIYLAMQQVSC